MPSRLYRPMGLYHPLDGVNNLKYKLFYFLTPNKKISNRKALAFNRDRCCHLVICLRLILLHYHNVCRLTKSSRFTYLLPRVHLACSYFKKWTLKNVLDTCFQLLFSPEVHPSLSRTEDAPNLNSHLVHFGPPLSVRNN